MKSITENSYTRFITESVGNVQKTIIPLIQKHKATISAVAAFGCGVASCVTPPPANAILLGMTKALGGASVFMKLREDFNNFSKTLTNNTEKAVKGVTSRLSDVTTAMGGTDLKPLELKEISPEKRKSMSEMLPIMSEAVKSAWKSILQCITMENRPTFGGEQMNYDCVYMYGPPGTGKTIFAKALFGSVPEKYQLNLVNITAGNLIERGAAKLNLLKQDIGELMKTATQENPICIGLFLDEVEASLNKDRSLTPGVVNEYLTLVNEIKDAAAQNPNVYILGALATNFDEQVDNASKRDGRVTHNLHIDYPDATAKQQLVDYAVKKLDKRVINSLGLTDAETLKTHLLANKQVQESLSENNLVGASIVQAMAQSQMNISANQYRTLKSEQKLNNFLELFANNLKKSAAKATADRKKDEENLKAKKAFELQLARIAEALESNNESNDENDMGKTLIESIQGIVKQLAEIARKTGDNTQLEEIMRTFGATFKEMQTNSNEDRQAIIEKLSTFINTIQSSTNEVNTAKTRVVSLAEKATAAAERAITAERDANNAFWAKNNANRELLNRIAVIEARLEAQLKNLTSES